MKTRPNALLLCLLAAMLTLAACSGGGGSGAASTPAPSTGSSKPATTAKAEPTTAPSAESPAEGIAEPTTLTLWHPDMAYAEKTYAAVTEKFPNLTMNYVGGELKDLIASGKVPDLVFSANPADIPGLQELDLLLPLDDLIAKRGVDLSPIRQNVIEFYRSFGENNQLYLLPHNYSTWGLYFNKKIFDKFGVDYPKDGMTWDEVIDLAAQLTKTEDGIQYIGLHPGPIQKMISQTGFGYVDPATDKPNFEGSKEMERIVELLKRIVDIPGNLPTETPYDWFMAHQWSGGGDFVAKQNMAMHVTWNNVGPYSNLEKETGLSWDVVSWPLVGAGFPAVDPEPAGDSFGIGKHSKSPEAAMEVLKYLLSEEYQLINIGLTGKAPIVDSGALNDAFKQQAPGKNLQAYITNPPASSSLKSHSPFERATWAAVDKGIESLIAGEDTNTALAKMQEAAELIVEEAKKTR